MLVRNSKFEHYFEVVHDSVAKLAYQMALVPHMVCRVTDQCDDESATLVPISK